MKDILLVALLLIAAGASAKDMTSSGGGVYMKVQGQSGKIAIGGTDPPSKDPNGVVIEFDELKEIDQYGNEVGKSGNPKHSFNTFASQEFIFSVLKSVTYQGVQAVSFNFTATINGATLRVVTYIFTEKGRLTNGNETIEVHNGTCKFNIEIEQWTFCGGGNCRDEVGKYLDLKITVKGKKKAEKKEDDDDDDDDEDSDDSDDDDVDDDYDSDDSDYYYGYKKNGKKPEGYELGGGIEFIVSTEVNIDGVWMDLPDSYPQHEQQGSKDSFTFRFPKFTNRVFYDPLVNSGSDDDSESGASNIKFNLSLLILVLVAMVAFIF